MCDVAALLVDPAPSSAARDATSDSGQVCGRRSGIMYRCSACTASGIGVGQPRRRCSRPSRRRPRGSARGPSVGHQRVDARRRSSTIDAAPAAGRERERRSPGSEGTITRACSRSSGTIARELPDAARPAVQQQQRRAVAVGDAVHAVDDRAARSRSGPPRPRASRSRRASTRPARAPRPARAVLGARVRRRRRASASRPGGAAGRRARASPTLDREALHAEHLESSGCDLDVEPRPGGRAPARRSRKRGRRCGYSPPAPMKA